MEKKRDFYYKGALGPVHKEEKKSKKERGKKKREKEEIKTLAAAAAYPSRPSPPASVQELSRVDAATIRRPSPRAPVPRHESRVSAPRAAPVCPASRADPQPSSRAGPCFSSRATKPIWLLPSNFWGVLDQVTAAAWDFFGRGSIRTSLLGKHTCLAIRTRQVNLQHDAIDDMVTLWHDIVMTRTVMIPIRVVPAWVSFRITTYLRLCGPTGHQSSMDIDMTQVTRRGPRIPIVLSVPRDTEDQIYVPTGAHVARVRERARDWVEAEVRAKASWRATRRRMPPHRGARQGGGRGGRGVGRGQPEEQPAAPAVDPNAPVTQADLAAMEHRYQDMLQATLAPFLAAQQNQAAPIQAWRFTWRFT
ncbi:uncharacterized protein E6C27_scaffold1371G00160 [Cucumis melo var. makuwa]|uniref:Gag protease polyprotein n=1 Tax=Cucumis melo var. makuwa TaxID=1194695 RepID=A0A5A7UE72_CUCMM|nr:uncharacterized protein E6C27_scaffold1371G00160 [Cucumis melo var. makuwa]